MTLWVLSFESLLKVFPGFHDSNPGIPHFFPRDVEGRLILLAQQLDELAAGERRNHCAGKRSGPLPYHVQIR